MFEGAADELVKSGADALLRHSVCQAKVERALAQVHTPEPEAQESISDLIETSFVLR